MYLDLKFIACTKPNGCGVSKLLRLELSHPFAFLLISAKNAAVTQRGVSLRMLKRDPEGHRA
jgi:hypothetical protein